MTAAPSQRRSTYREVLAEPRFRLLFVTRSLAIAADTLRVVALSVLVFASTGSALLSAITYGIGFLPQILGVALLGTLADRVRPRRLIVASYILEAGTAAVLGLARLPAGDGGAQVRTAIAVPARAAPVRDAGGGQDPAPGPERRPRVGCDRLLYLAAVRRAGTPAEVGYVGSV